MKLVNPFDATQVDPTQGMGQLPVGRHPVVIIGSEIRPNKDNTGGMLVLELGIIDGPHKGTTGPYRLNLYNNSQKAAEIAHKQLSAICHVTGVFKVDDSAQLHNIPFMVEVGEQPKSDSNPDGKYTEIKKVFDRNGNEPGKAPAPTAQQPAQAPQPPAAPQAPAQPQWGAQQPAAQPQAPAAAWGQPAPAAQQPAAPAATGWAQNQSGAATAPPWARQ